MRKIKKFILSPLVLVLTFTMILGFSVSAHAEVPDARVKPPVPTPRTKKQNFNNGSSPLKRNNAIKRKNNTENAGDKGQTSTSARAQEQNQKLEAEAEEKGTEAANDLFSSRTQEWGISQESLNDLRESMGRVKVTDDVPKAVESLEEGLDKCKEYVEQAKECCDDAVSCGEQEGEPSRFSQLVSTMESSATSILAILLGTQSWGGAMASCVQSFPGLMSGLAASKGEAKVCKHFREGREGTPGCVHYCSEVGEAADLLVQSINSNLMPQAESKANSGEPALVAEGKKDKITLETSLQRLETLKHKATTQKIKGKAQTQKGERLANAASGALQVSMMGAVRCADAFANGGQSLEDDPSDNADNDDDDGDDDDPFVIDPSSPALLGYNGDYKAGGPSRVASRKAGSGPRSSRLPFARNRDGNSQKAASSNFGNSNPNNGQGANGGGSPSFFGGGRGLAGAGSQKAGGSDSGRRGYGSSRDLIAGYGNSRRGSSGSGGYGFKSNFNPFKFKKSKKSKKNKQKAKRAKAVAKLLASAGVSPNAQDDIFVRNTKRFVASSIKERLFDSRRNKKLWMKR